MDSVAQENDFVTKVQIGVTYGGRKISALKISKQSPDNVTKSTIYIDALTHPREWITPAATMFAFKEVGRECMISEISCLQELLLPLHRTVVKSVPFLHIIFFWKIRPHLIPIIFRFS